jgi:hypothetical protein
LRLLFLVLQAVVEAVVTAEAVAALVGMFLVLAISVLLQQRFQ